MQLDEALDTLKKANLIVEASDEEFDESTVRMISVLLSRTLDNITDNIMEDRYGIDSEFPEGEDLEVSDKVRTYIRKNIKELI